MLQHKTGPDGVRYFSRSKIVLRYSGNQRRINSQASTEGRLPCLKKPGLFQPDCVPVHKLRVKEGGGEGGKTG